jgi:L-seryl-tRNA(Ser) seleniumtransferase
MNQSGTAGTVYDRLGVKRLINGHHWRTVLGGSIMPPAVVQAMADSAGYFVNLEELHRKAGEYIAGLTGAGGAMVTAGCAAAQVLQAAACMTGTDAAKVASLPNSGGMKNEVIIQRCQRNHYDSAYEVAGANIVEIGSEDATGPAELESAITDRTAAVAYVWVMRYWGLSLEEVIEIAHGRGVPVVLDAASELPPVENLGRFISMGTDMVAFSGGKGIRGPQSTGILTGRADLMEAAWENAFSFNKPRAGIGRAMKVCKEEIVGLVAALELFVDADHEAEWADWRAKSQRIVDAAAGVHGVEAYVHEGPNYEGPTAPTAWIVLGESRQGPSVEDVEQALLQGDPPIYIGSGPGERELWVAPVELQEGEDDIVARRLVEALGRHSHR